MESAFSANLVITVPGTTVELHVRRGVQIPIQMVQPVRPAHLPVCARPDII